MGLKRENRNVRILAHIVMVLATALALFPFLLLFSSSLMSEEAIAAYGYGFFPREVSFEAYSYLFKAWSTIGKAYLITIGVTIIGTILSMLVTTLLAFGLAWNKTPGRKVIMVLLVITLLFNGGAVSSYIVYTNVLHVQDTIWGLILPNMLMNAFTVILFMNYFKNTVSIELMEAAQIDGANMFHIYWKLYIPLSLPLLATIGLTTAIAYWNDWNNSLYYISSAHTELYSVQRLLREMQESIKFIASNPSLGLSTDNLPGSSIQMAIAVIGILPILITYPFFQKYFIAGIALGGVKE